ncbi:MAG: sigma-70 family RNA polymerase sigma factor [Rhizobacter sp.]|nr:sigma-70 family RNA polymerase sigma factor [Rhizobacter sp.]
MINIGAVFARVKRALMRRGRTVHEAEDLVQEAWLRVASVGGLDKAANPAGFLMRTALNLSIDAHRAQSARGEEVAIEDVVLTDAAPGAEDQVLGRERMARMYVCLGRLPARSRAIFVAHRVEGLTYSEVAREMGISVTAVEKHVTKATLLITHCMEGW